MRFRPAACLLLCIAAAGPAAAESTVPGKKLLQEEWHIMLLNGTPSGFAHHRSVETVTEDGTPVIISEIEEAVSLRMGGITISITSKGVFVEDMDGSMRSFSYAQDDGMVKKVTRGVVEGGKLHLLINSGGETYAREMDFPDGVIVGYAEEMLVRDKGFVPGTAYSYKTYAPDLGVINVTRKVIGKGRIQLRSGVKELNRVDMSGMMPGVTISEYRDDSGRAVAAKLPVFGMEFVLEAASQEEVKRMLRSGKTSDSVEIIGLRYAKIVNPHPRPRRVERAVYLLQSIDEKPFEDFDLSGSGQKARAGKEGITLEVSFPGKHLEGAWKYVEEAVPVLGIAPVPCVPPPPCPHAECLASGPYMQSDLREIQRRSRDIVLNAVDYLDAARRLERWVRENIMATGAGMNFAPAATILKHRKGDCTEMAVLLASLLRAARIPCRLVVGVTQLQGLIGFHMWVEVWGGVLHGEEVWIPFDSAIPSGRRVDATHIRMASVSDDASAMGAMASLAQIIGRLSVTGVRYIAGELEWRKGQPWASVVGGRLIHKGFLVTFPMPLEMRLGRVDAGGALRLRNTADKKHTITIAAEEMPPEYRLDDTVRNILARGWRVTRKDYPRVDGRRALEIDMARPGTPGSTEDRRIRALYIHDGDTVIRIVEEPRSTLSREFKGIRKNFRFLCEPDYD